MITRNNTGNSLIPVIVLATLSMALWCTGAIAHEVPHNDESVLNTPAEDRSSHSENPSHHDIREWITAFRRTGDDRYLDRAWTILKPVLDSGSTNADLLLDAAMVAQSRHQFETALSLVDQSLSIAINNDQAWLLRAAIHLVRGDADEADRDCSELRYVRTLVVITCNARVSIARGEHRAPLRKLSGLLDSAAADSLNADWLAWSLSVAGDAAAPIDAAQAVNFYQKSLLAAESTQVRAALVDVLLAENQLDVADKVLDAGAGALPLSIRRMIVSKRIGRRSTEKQIAIVDHEFRHWIARKDWLHAREMARFYLDVMENPTLARRLAEINLDMQREPEDLLLAARTRVLQ